MALFKIFNNIGSKKLDETTNKYQYNALPSTSHTGYCYFDAGTNLFYIDIADSAEGINVNTLSESEQLNYRIPLNASKAAYASVALKDLQNNVINETYFNDLSITGAIISGVRPDGTKKDIAIPEMEGATLLKIGSSGLVPAPQKGAQHYFFRGDGSWSLINAKVNGTIFNGIDDITTASWGAKHAFRIEDYLGDNSGSAVSVNGSEDIILKLPETIKANIDGTVSSLAHTLSINGFDFDGSANISVGPISEKYGGTGQTKLEDSANALINALSIKTDSLTDGDYIIAQYAGGDTETKTYHRYAISKLWDYIQPKISNNFAAKSHSHGITDITNLQIILNEKAAISHSHNYAGSSFAGGAANSANKLNTNAGSVTQPIYFENGVPVAIVGAIANSTTGNAASSDKVNHTLSFTVGGVSKGSFNGSEDHTVDVNAMDLNISGALTYLGRTNTKPTNATVALTSGTTVTAVAGNVVICIADNKEYLYDNDGTWVDIGGTSSYSLKPHIHGNIDSAGFLTSELGVAQSNRLMRTDGTGKIVAGLAFGLGTTKFLAENGTWQTSGYHKTGSWSGLTYTATAVNGAEELKFTLPTGISGTTLALGNHSHNQYLPLTGGTMTGALTLKADPAANLEAATKQYVDNKLIGAGMVRQDVTISIAAASINIPTAIQTALNNGSSLLVYQEGLLLLPTINYVIALGNGSITLVNYSCEAGDTFTFCALPSGLDLTDLSSGTFMPIAGGAMTGALTLSGAPTADLHAATKAYVDGVVTDCAKVSALSNYVKKTGDTMTGDLILKKTTTIADNYSAALKFQVTQLDNNITSSAYIAVFDDGDANAWGTNMVIQSAGNVVIGSGEAPSATYTNLLKTSTAENTYVVADGSIMFYTNCGTWSKHTASCYINTSGVLYGACWNDYAEYREGDTIEAGRCVVETGDDNLVISTARMIPGASVVSDTFGFAIGETENNKTPIAVSGRVLAYPYENREEFKKAIGHPVCSGPDGTVSIMSDEEYTAKGYCAIGIISAVPDYETWGTGSVPVNGRVWIKVI